QVVVENGAARKQTVGAGLWVSAWPVEKVTKRVLKVDVNGGDGGAVPEADTPLDGYAADGPTQQVRRRDRRRPGRQGADQLVVRVSVAHLGARCGKSDGMRADAHRHGNDAGLSLPVLAGVPRRRPLVDRHIHHVDASLRAAGSGVTRERWK